MAVIGAKEVIGAKTITTKTNFTLLSKGRVNHNKTAQTVANP